MLGVINLNEQSIVSFFRTIKIFIEKKNKMIGMTKVVFVAMLLLSVGSYPSV